MYKILILFLILTLNNQAQSPINIFNNLSSGALLVRLKTNNNTIRYLKNKGDTALMNKIIKYRDVANNEIIDAFEKNFTYCKIYYFYSINTKSIANKKFENILLDNNLQIIKKPIPLEANYFIAEFSTTNQNKDTTQYWNYSEWNIKNGKAQKVDYYYSGNNENTINALVLLMPDFKIIPNNYPNYVRTFKKIPFLERTKAETVKKLQSKILSFEKNLNNQ